MNPNCTLWIVVVVAVVDKNCPLCANNKKENQKGKTSKQERMNLPVHHQQKQKQNKKSVEKLRLKSGEEAPDLDKKNNKEEDNIK